MPFGPFLLLKRLAVGGMAELFLAKDTRTDQVVVIKRILPYLAEEDEFVKMFLDEARIVSQLHHPNVVELKELGQREGTLYIAMEWVDGIDLRKVANEYNARHKAPIPWRIITYIATKLADGLHYAHNRVGPDGAPLEIVHRDISPQNLMLGYRGEVKLVDFGIAKASAWMSRSKPGIIKGKFLYLAPEQIQGDVVDHRTDIFATGSLIYELTAGKAPFYRPTSEAVIYAIRREAAVPPTEIMPGYPQPLSDIVMRCLEKDPSKRYQSCDELRRALEGVLHGKAATTRMHLAQFMDELYGDADERTALNVPESQAQLPKVGSEDPTDERRSVPPRAPAEEPDSARRPPARPSREQPELRRSAPVKDEDPTDQRKAVPKRTDDATDQREALSPRGAVLTEPHGVAMPAPPPPDARGSPADTLDEDEDEDGEKTNLTMPVLEPVSKRLRAAARLGLTLDDDDASSARTNSQPLEGRVAPAVAPVAPPAPPEPEPEPEPAPQRNDATSMDLGVAIADALGPNAPSALSLPFIEKVPEGRGPAKRRPSLKTNLPPPTPLEESPSQETPVGPPVAEADDAVLRSLPQSQRTASRGAAPAAEPELPWDSAEPSRRAERSSRHSPPPVPDEPEPRPPPLPPVREDATLPPPPNDSVEDLPAASLSDQVETSDVSAQSRPSEVSGRRSAQTAKSGPVRPRPSGEKRGVEPAPGPPAEPKREPPVEEDEAPDDEGSPDDEDTARAPSDVRRAARAALAERTDSAEDRIATRAQSNPEIEETGPRPASAGVSRRAIVLAIVGAILLVLSGTLAVVLLAPDLFEPERPPSLEESLRRRPPKPQPPPVPPAPEPVVVQQQPPPEAAVPEPVAPAPTPAPAPAPVAVQPAPQPPPPAPPAPAPAPPPRPVAEPPPPPAARPVAEPATPPTVLPVARVPTAAPPTQPQVRFRAVKGVRDITANGVPINPGEIRGWPAGPLTVSWRCPAKRAKAAPKAQELEVVVSNVISREPQTIDLDCP